MLQISYRYNCCGLANITNATVLLTLQMLQFSYRYKGYSLANVTNATV